MEENFSSSPRIIAHRGCPQHAPENTLPAFEEAIRLGADGIEFDVHLTADGEAIVHHDYQSGRVFAGKGSMAEYTLAGARGLELNKRLYERCDERLDRICVPTLAEVLDLGRSRAQFEVQLCTPDMRLLERVLTEIRRCDVWDDVELTSEHVPLLCHVAGVAPGLPTGLFFSALPAYLRPALGLSHVMGWLTLARARVAHLPLSRIDMVSVDALHAAGFRVHGADLNTADAIRSGIALGIDQFSTDELELALSVVHAACA